MWLLTLVVLMAINEFVTSQSSVMTRSLMGRVVTVAGSSGSWCNTNKPNETVAMKAGSRSQCAAACLSRSCCVLHQMNNDVEQCQLFDTLSTNYNASGQCQAITAVRQDSGGVQYPVGTADTCTIPFTYGGQMYYTCVTNYNVVPCHTFCLIQNSQYAVCSLDAYGVVAVNSTVNVTIPTVAGSVPLRSVNGWLTVLSRINTDFPLNLSYALYQSGFGNVSDNYWLGLDRLHLLTDNSTNGGRNYRLRFEVLLLVNQTWQSTEYDLFYIESEATNYTLRVSTPGYGDGGDAINLGLLWTSNGTKFYYVNTGNNCVRFAGPWWFQKNVGIPLRCSNWRMFGVSTNTIYSGFSWNGAPSAASTPSDVPSLAVARMMVKLIDD